MRFPQKLITIGLTKPQDFCKINTMQTKPYTIEELIHEMWESNYSHFEFMDNMNGGDCDCNLHVTINTIADYMGWNKDEQ